MTHGTERIDPAKSHFIPAAVIRSIAAGLFMMAFFTALWAGIAYGGLYAGPFRFGLIFFLVFIIAFVIQGIKLLRAAHRHPEIRTEEEAAEKKRVGKWFGIIFGAEGLAIFLAINIVNNLGHPDLTIPVIALVVGLHFYPLARIFKRTIDYYLATWSTIIAVCAIIFTLYKTIPAHSILVFTGVGIALATSSYGTYMMIAGDRFIKQNPER
jgi:hypothetical protein